MSLLLGPGPELMRYISKIVLGAGIIGARPSFLASIKTATCSKQVAVIMNIGN